MGLKQVNADRVSQLPVAAPINLEDANYRKALLKRHKLSDEEFQNILNIKKSGLTLAELGVFSAMWSEHCSYKSSRAHLRRLPTSGPKVVVGPGENAGVVQLHGELCIAFKMESHNHPSYIEPYQGAATGVGGILRDVFCMGARPIANLNCLRFGIRSHPRTNYLLERVVKGIGDYGNCVGVPTVGGSVSFDETYNGNCLVNAMTVGLIRRDKIFKGFAAGIGNLVVYVGSATGRDGINGATMASDSFENSAATSKTTVQVGDPFAEKLLLEATLEVLEKELVVGIQDMGAAGLTSSSFEMAGRAGNGIYINLDLVPLRAPDMSAYEIMLSESQERMLMVVDPKKWDALSAVLSKWQLPHAVIGLVTPKGRMQIEAGGVLEIDLPVGPLTDNAPLYLRPVGPEIVRQKESLEIQKFGRQLDEESSTASDIYQKILSDVGSKQKIYSQFDQHVGTRTVLGPNRGGAAVLWVRSEESKDEPFLGVAIASGCNERRVKNAPKIGAAQAVLDCAKKIIAAGGEPLAVTDCLNFGSAEDPSVMRDLSDSIDGIAEACERLSTPVVSGNVSLYNATGSVGIYPSPMIGMVGRVQDVRKVTPAIVEEADDIVFYHLKTGKMPSTVEALAGSLAAKNFGISPEEGRIPEIDWAAEAKSKSALCSLRETGLLRAARPIGDGGAGVALFKLSARLLMWGYSLKILAKDAASFFGEGVEGYLIAIPTVHSHQVLDVLKKFDVTMDEAGRVYRDSNFDKSLDIGSTAASGMVETYFGRLSARSLLLSAGFEESEV